MGNECRSKELYTTNHSSTRLTPILASLKKNDEVCLPKFLRQRKENKTKKENGTFSYDCEQEKYFFF